MAGGNITAALGEQRRFPAWADSRQRAATREGAAPLTCGEYAQAQSNASFDEATDLLLLVCYTMCLLRTRFASSRYVVGQLVVWSSTTRRSWPRHAWQRTARLKTNSTSSLNLPAARGISCIIYQLMAPAVLVPLVQHSLHSRVTARADKSKSYCFVVQQAWRAKKRSIDIGVANGIVATIKGSEVFDCFRHQRELSTRQRGQATSVRGPEDRTQLQLA